MPNEVIVRGNLVRDPELRYTQSGKPIMSFTVASNKTTKGADGTEYKKSYFASCKTWFNGDLWVDWLKKGTSVIVLGEIEQEEWTGKDGQKKSRDVVNAFTVAVNQPWLCTPSKAGPNEADEFPPEVDDDEVPF